jgi:hypothetical protein
MQQAAWQIDSPEDFKPLIMQDLSQSLPSALVRDATNFRGSPGRRCKQRRRRQTNILVK